ncbi:hypothetical protein CS535_08095 [Yersinia massiliensis]|nr:hypothetical protein CRN74_18600 [Yersinia frederiksenii]OWF72667.1 hypothetical protein B4902_12455 [Yersinia frederiksenii]PHZ24280.1 hypothetical protein CS535_08095 [Yersinia massiliensis]
MLDIAAIKAGMSHPTFKSTSYADIIRLKINGYHHRENRRWECTIVLDRVLLRMSLISVKNSS